MASLYFWSATRGRSISQGRRRREAGGAGRRYLTVCLNKQHSCFQALCKGEFYLEGVYMESQGEKHNPPLQHSLHQSSAGSSCPCTAHSPMVRAVCTLQESSGSHQTCGSCASEQNLGPAFHGIVKVGKFLSYHQIQPFPQHCQGNH